MELPQADAANRSGYSVKSAKTIAPINRGKSYCDTFKP